jgi:hypothetical protein
LPSKQDCDDGDITLFAGLLCAAGIDLGCQTVRLAQDDTGRFWRSPRRVGQAQPNSFSRDMALGVLLYLTQSRDQLAAEAWLDWIDAHARCQIQGSTGCVLKTYHLCDDADDGRCLMTPGLWAQMGRVWQTMDWPLHPQMEQWGRIGESTMVDDARSVGLGYQLHLKAVTAFLYRQLEVAGTLVDDVVQVLVERQPDNPFFRWLRWGNSPELAARLMSLCPANAPVAKFQWAWERETSERAWEDSMLWDGLPIRSLASLRMMSLNECIELQKNRTLQITISNS